MSDTTNQTPPWITRTALARQSMRAVDKIADPSERRAAFNRHMATYPPGIGRV